MYEFKIYQVKDGEEYRDKRFAPMSPKLRYPDRSDYDLVYEERCLGNEIVTPGDIYVKFQHGGPQCPEDFTGRSLSISDIIEIRYNSDKFLAEYVDSVGFATVSWKLDLKRKIPRFTVKDLIDMSYDLLIAEGIAEDWVKIEEYYLTDNKNGDRVITDMDFDIISQACYGGCEGIYIDLSVNGCIGGEGNSERFPAATLKTLNGDLRSLLTAGEFGTAFTWAAREITGANWYSFLPDTAIEKARMSS